MKIFFQGSLQGEWMSGRQRCETLKGLDQEVVPFCQHNAISQAQPSAWERRLGVRRFRREVLTAFNCSWLEAIVATRPEIAWLEWPRLLERETLQRARESLPECRFVAFFDDNPFGERSREAWQWDLYLAAVAEFDLHLVKRKTDIDELKKRGARRAELFMHGFYEPLFHPRRENCEEYNISFVGTALDHRIDFIHQLIGKQKLPVSVFGHRWDRTLPYFFHRKSFFPAVVGPDYAEVLRRSRINLGFVSSSNRDEYTMRSFEIPACGGFLFAERTPTHQELFKEGEEAEFFGSVEECNDKARFYLKDSTSRRRIGSAGYERCIRSDYSLKRRLKDVLEIIGGSGL